MILMNATDAESDGGDTLPDPMLLGDGPTGSDPLVSGR